MTMEERQLQIDTLNDELLTTLEANFGFQDAAFVYTWKHSLLAVLTEWNDKVTKIHTMDDNNEK